MGRWDSEREVAAKIGVPEASRRKIYGETIAHILRLKIPV